VSVRKTFIAVAGAGVIAICLAASAHAQATTGSEPPPKGPLDDIQQSVISAIEKGLNILSVAIGKVLPYKLPEVLPNGDIIIRYVPPEPPPPPLPPPADAPTDEPQKT
jgi:hypothetical protein